jgi:hypothetical protein
MESAERLTDAAKRTVQKKKSSPSVYRYLTLSESKSSGSAASQPIDWFEGHDRFASRLVRR